MDTAATSCLLYTSSDCSLQPDYTKLETLVIADQNAAVNTFPGLVHTCLLYTSEKEMYSDIVKKGLEKTPHRSLFKASGFTDEEIERPLIGLSLIHI